MNSLNSEYKEVLERNKVLTEELIDAVKGLSYMKHLSFFVTIVLFIILLRVIFWPL